MDILENISTVRGHHLYAATDTQAWSAATCPNCHNPNMLTVAIREREVYYSHGYALNAWLLCVSCGTGAVADEYGRISPSIKEFPTPDGTPSAEKKVWEEVRDCLAVGAYNASAMLCRKLLLHLVFTHERSQDPGATARNINFAQAVQYLVDRGVITAAYGPLATEIRNIGNRANHELPDITRDEARKIALFTHHMFVSVYEMPKKASISTAFVGAAAEPYEGDLEPEATPAEAGGE